MTNGSQEKEFTVYLRESEYTVEADRFSVDDGVLKFLSGTTLVAAFSAWDGVL